MDLPQQSAGSCEEGMRGNMVVTRWRNGPVSLARVQLPPGKPESYSQFLGTQPGSRCVFLLGTKLVTLVPWGLARGRIKPQSGRVLEVLGEVVRKPRAPSQRRRPLPSPGTCTFSAVGEVHRVPPWRPFQGRCLRFLFSRLPPARERCSGRPLLPAAAARRDPRARCS